VSITISMKKHPLLRRLRERCLDAPRDPVINQTCQSRVHATQALDDHAYLFDVFKSPDRSMISVLFTIPSSPIMICVSILI